MSDINGQVMKQHREPTYTSIILAHLRQSDDLLTTKDLEHCLPKHIPRKYKAAVASATVSHLSKSNAIGYEIQSGKKHWFALPPEQDTRSRVHPEVIHDAKRPTRALNAAKADRTKTKPKPKPKPKAARYHPSALLANICIDALRPSGIITTSIDGGEELRYAIEAAIERELMR